MELSEDMLNPYPEPDYASMRTIINNPHNGKCIFPLRKSLISIICNQHEMNCSYLYAAILFMHRIDDLALMQYGEANENTQKLR